MPWDFTPGSNILINFENYSIIGCDEATQRRISHLYNINIEDQWVIKN